MKSFCGLMGFFLGNDTLYWTDLGSNKISRTTRDQTWREDVINTGIVRAEGVAVDWIAGTGWIVWMKVWTEGGTDGGRDRRMESDQLVSLL